VWLAILLPLTLVLAALRERVTNLAESAPAWWLALLLVLQLRLWDDLRDVEQDRQIHPERVLCQAVSLRPFWGLLFVLMAINLGLAMLLRGWHAVVLLLGLHSLLATWYGWRGSANTWPAFNYHVVLLKYPLIVWMLGAVTVADVVSAPLVVSTVVVYLGVCIFEVAHDPQLWRLRSAQVCLSVECLLLAAIGCLMVLFERFRFWP
jgi:4-hydroxybenzoate polyprenyltransferase